MLITNKEELKKFGTDYRVWQGIPGIEVTKNGRIFAAFYSGNVKEDFGNYVVLVKSDDDGTTWTEPIAVAYKSQFYRCYDQCLWIDPLGRLWFIWAVAPDNAVYAVICDDPDADELEWSDEFFIGYNVMLNKPTVLSSGEWLFPIAVWRTDNTTVIEPKKDKISAPNLYKTVDNGKTFTLLQGPEITSRIFDEHMTVELNNGTLLMLVRTLYGIAKAVSYDYGETWSREEQFEPGGPCSRFYIGRLKSGRILLVNHYKFKGRNNLTAMLSEDEGKTWKYTLLLDERNEVSYPDVKQTEDGFIYIIYDRERGGFKKNYEEAKQDAREILMAKITEEDIINGELVNPESKLKCIISKLGEYKGDMSDIERYYNQMYSYTSEDITELIVNQEDNGIVLDKLFANYSIGCQNMHTVDIQKLDGIINDIRMGNIERFDGMEKINNILKNCVDIAASNREEPIVDETLKYIMENYNKNISIGEIADKLGVSVYYLCHLFKKKTAVSIIKYRDQYRLASAKRMLIETDDSIADISDRCGYSDSAYFIKCFRKKENITPAKYRENNK